MVGSLGTQILKIWLLYLGAPLKKSGTFSFCNFENPGCVTCLFVTLFILVIKNHLSLSINVLLWVLFLLIKVCSVWKRC